MNDVESTPTNSNVLAPVLRVTATLPLISVMPVTAAMVTTVPSVKPCAVEVTTAGLALVIAVMFLLYPWCRLSGSRPAR